MRTSYLALLEVLSHKSMTCSVILLFCLILKTPDWSVAQGYHGVESGGFAIGNPSKYNGIPKRAREVRLSLRLERQKLDLRKDLPEEVK